jgi:hypothetical protein
MEQLPKVRKEKHRIIHRRDAEDAEDAEKLLKNEAINYETVSNSSGFFTMEFLLCVLCVSAVMNIIFSLRTLRSFRSLRLCGEFHGPETP